MISARPAPGQNQTPIRRKSWMEKAFPLVLALMLAPLLAGCGKPPPKTERKLTVSKGENTLDQIIRKAEQAPKPLPGRIVADPASLEFPPVRAGGTVSAAVTLTNRGGQKVGLASLRLLGRNPAFRLSEGGCLDRDELAGGASCLLALTFRPQRAGEADGELSILENGRERSLLTIAGRADPAEAASAPIARAEAAEASLAFARQRQDAGLELASADEAGDTAEAKRRLADPDYREAGLPGVVTTLPVDRSRVLTADRVIPAVLENTINSQLGGRAVAVVERPVFGADGRLVLIPAGTRAIGHFDPISKLGEARLAISWTRMIRPDGVDITIGDQAADEMGRSGVPGDLDERFLEKYGGSILTSVIAAAGQWAVNDPTVTTTGAGGATQVMTGRAMAMNRFGNDMDALGQRIVNETIDIRPVLTVPEGTRLYIIPSEDIWLQDPDHMRPVTAARSPNGGLKLGAGTLDTLLHLAPGLVDLLADNPALQKAAPQTLQQLAQAAILQQLRGENAGTAAPAASVPTGPSTQPALTGPQEGR